MSHLNHFLSGLSIKDVHTQGSSCPISMSITDILRIFGLFVAKKFKIVSIICDGADKRREGVKFSRFWANVFYGRPLTELYRKLILEVSLLIFSIQKMHTMDAAKELSSSTSTASNED